jgi:transposase
MPHVRPASSRTLTDVVVDLVAALEGAVELHLADDRAQRRLRELRDRLDVVRRAVRGELRIDHLEVDDPVHGELGVVLGDADLLRNVERDFLQRVLVGGCAR